MAQDPVSVVLSILLGAALYNAFDYRFGMTPRISAWLNRMMGEGEG